MTQEADSRALKPRWTRRKAERPGEVLEAALSVFVAHGYAGTRLEDVAALANISKGALYLYFKSKEDLFKAVVRENVVALIQASSERAAAFDGSSERLLRVLVDSWWQQFGSTRAGGISKLMVAESSNFPEIAQFFLEEVIEPWHALLAHAIDRGIASGEFRAVDTALHVRVIAAALVMLSLWKHSFGPCSAQPLDPEHYLATLLDVHLAALRPGAPRDPWHAPRSQKRRTAKNAA